MTEPCLLSYLIIWKIRKKKTQIAQSWTLISPRLAVKIRYWKSLNSFQFETILYLCTIIHTQSTNSPPQKKSELSVIFHDNSSHLVVTPWNAVQQKMWRLELGFLGEGAPRWHSESFQGNKMGEGHVTCPRFPTAVCVNLTDKSSLGWGLLLLGSLSFKNLMRLQRLLTKKSAFTCVLSDKKQICTPQISVHNFD